MKKVYCSFTEEEFDVLEANAKKLGFSIAKLVEYAAVLYVDMPRVITTNLSDIQKTINDFLNYFDGDSFICATPFGSEWAQMTASAKRTAASQMSLLEKAGIIECVKNNSKHHQAKVYKKV